MSFQKLRHRKLKKKKLLTYFICRNLLLEYKKFEKQQQRPRRRNKTNE